ncbi:MAG: PcfJ domain-containing protein [Oscillospiraceae bacterium]|nr:PcfJ domain-containing protein [Oscillospiraceae bacterium]
MAEQRNYEELLPNEPPEGMLDWLRSMGKLSSHLLIYKAGYTTNPLSGEREQMVHLTCSACGGKAWAGKVAGNCGRYATAPFGFWDSEAGKSIGSGGKTVCPLCGAPVEAVHVGQIRSHRKVEELWPMTVHRVEDKLVLIGWYVYKSVTAEGEERTGCLEYEAYVVEREKTVRLAGYVKCLSSVSFYGSWKQRKNCTDVWGSAELVYPWDAAMLEGTTAENSKLDLYMQQAETPYPVTYLRLWQRHRNVENLVMQGMGRLVGKMMEDKCCRYSYERAKGVPDLDAINWKEKRPSRMLGLTAEEFRWFREMCWGVEELGFYRYIKEKGVRLKMPEDMAGCVNAGCYWCKRIVEKNTMPLMRAVRYLEKQKALDKRCDGSMLDDYWRTALRLGYDLTDDHVRFPAKLMTAHDRVVRESRELEEARRSEERKKKNARFRKQFAERLKELERYAWQSGSILIRPCAVPEELDREGKTLNHCVATYKDIHAAGKRAIFFVRKVSEPETPWFTLELDLESLTVRQNRGKCNCARTKEVEAFEAMWLDHIRKVKKPKKQKEVKIA